MCGARGDRSGIRAMEPPEHGGSLRFLIRCRLTPFRSRSLSSERGLWKSAQGRRGPEFRAGHVRDRGSRWSRFRCRARIAGPVRPGVVPALIPFRLAGFSTCTQRHRTPQFRAGDLRDIGYRYPWSLGAVAPTVRGLSPQASASQRWTLESTKSISPLCLIALT